MNKKRCTWAKTDIDIKYHDKEWGRVVNDDRMLFELLILEGMQAGLSWNIVLKKREELRKAFDNFNYNICAKYEDGYLEKQLTNDKIIRSKLKIYSIRKNALAFIKVQKEFGSFFNYMWSFTNYKQINNINLTASDVASKSELSSLISKDLKRREFTFVGETIIYSYL
ncbi:DNA-3-methyladenine glycosylase I [Gemella sp. zg-570]|uniref:DNA-3-methyladenine glycosylase I n=2 Tax=unclassified Gemella TaxID=2624949 RepID=UPI001C0AC3EC|nr:DNA-3-methyladenine glycosylase I [Gemella sp. zg-570]QWQ39460.1 DNA-3-methyladenine glycosylase I [Gemella sp. zg-570]